LTLLTFLAQEMITILIFWHRKWPDVDNNQSGDKAPVALSVVDDPWPISWWWILHVCCIAVKSSVPQGMIVGVDMKRLVGV
jgi:hypothetical protein